MRPASPLSIVVSAYDGLEYTKLLVKSLRESSRYGHEVIVYSDGSTDGTKEWLRAQADIRWQHDRTNRGICTAMNRAARMATREYLFFPNTDHVLAPGWDEALLPHLAPRRVVSFQCVEPGIVPVAPIFHARNCGTRWDEFDATAFARAAAEIAQPTTVPGVNYPFVISRVLWDEAGGLDELFNPGPANDPDLFYRLHLLGAEMVRAEDCVIYHFSGKSSRLAGEATSERREWHEVTERNEARFAEKWGERYRYANGGLPDPGPEARRRWEGMRRTSAPAPVVEVATRLRVTIDARAVEPGMQGIGIYIQSLAAALRKLPNAPDLLCLARSADAVEAPVRVIADDAGAARAAEEAGAQVFHGPAFVLPRELRPPGVITVHDVAFKLHPEWYPPAFVQHLGARLEESLEAARAVIAVSDRTREDLLRFWPSASSKTVRIHEAAPEDISGPRADAALMREKYAAGAPFILSIGVQQRRKNAVGLIRAYALITERPFRLVLVGGRDCEDPMLMREIEERGLAADVTLTPHLPREELLGLLGAADLFVYPSCYEGFGLPVLEAMALGVPVVCARAGSLPEIAGDAAILVDPARPGSIAEGIREALRGRDALATRGRERAREFTWDRAARETLAVYERAAAEARDLGTVAPHRPPAEPRRTLRVAVETRLLGHDRLGTGRYTTEIMRGLLAYPGANAEWVLIGPDTVDPSVLPNTDRILATVEAGAATLLDAAWEQFSLPTHLLGCDAFFSPTGIVPVARPCRAVTVVHDLGFEDHPEHYEPRLRAHLATWVRNACMSADRIIAVSRFTAGRVRERYGVEERRISVVHHGAPRMPRAALGEEATPFILCVSSFEPNKNLPMLVDAFWTLVSEWPGRLVIAGRTGRDLDAVRGRIRAHRLEERVELLVDPDDGTLARLYAGAALFAYPSVYEGFGLPLLEAMSAGLPVIANNVASCPEVVAEAGVLVRDASVRSWALELRRLVTDEALCRDLGRRARERAASFTWEKAAAETWAAIASVVEAR